MAKITKAQKGKKLTVARTRQVADSLENVGKQKIQSGVNRTTRPGGSYDSISKELSERGAKDIANAKRYRSLADKAEGKKPAMKSGGKVVKKSAKKK